MYNSKNSPKTFNTETIDQVLAMRDFKLPPLFSGTATADFSVLLEFTPNSPQFKTIDVKFDNGSQKLKTVFSKALANLDFHLISPDNDRVRVLRRGKVICGVGCEFMLDDANSPDNSHPMPLKVVDH